MPCAAAPQDSVGQLQVADAQATFTRSGMMSLALGQKTLIARTCLVVAAPEWRGSGSQASCTVREGYPRRDGGTLVFSGDIIEPTSQSTWRYTQRVSAEGDALRFACEVQPQSDADVGEVCLFIDLPIETWAGQRICLWPTAETVFPPTRPDARHFLSGAALKAVLGAPESGQMSLSFGHPTLCTVQDAREYGGTVYQIYPRLLGGGRVKAGQTLRLDFSLLPRDTAEHPGRQADYRADEPLSVGPLSLSAPTVPVYRRLEIDFEATGRYETPFDPDQIRVDAHVRCPSGREVIAPAFFHQGYSLRSEGGLTWLEPEGSPGWKVRFAPVEVGEHSVHVTAQDRSGEARSKPASFQATAPDTRGFVRVSTDDPRYFAFDDGTPYFAVGENLCVYRNGVTDYDQWIPRLGAAGGNYIRIWMCSSCFGIEWGKPGHYRLEPAWELDHALELAEENGVYVKLCLESWRRFTGRGSFYRPGDVHPYWSRNGGPCDTEMEAFTVPEAKRMFRNRLRYCVARWGYSPHILAWEFWNEINCVNGYDDDPRVIDEWTAEMARYLRQADPWRHMVVNSLGSFVLDDELWSLPEMDFAQVHGYWHPTLPDSRETGKDMAEMVPLWIGKIVHFGKPALFAEYGLVNEHWGHSPLADEDKEGVHLHNGLWSAVMSGAAGTAMLWWWDTYVDAQDLYHVFTPVARFVEDVPWTTAGFRPADAQADAPGLRVLGLQGRDLALLWLHNRAHTWWNVIHGVAVPEIERATVSVRGLPDGPWDAEWWDTWSGRVLRRETLASTDGRLTLGVAGLARDAAVKLSRRPTPR